MINKYKKGAFIITLLLFLVALPLTIVGFYFHFQTPEEENKNHEFHYNNKLYFYDANENLIGKYACMYKNCDFATQTVTDSEYKIKYYEDYEEKTELIDNQYAFIADFKEEQTMVNLYDIKNDTTLANYKSVKNYGIGIKGDYYIVENLNGMYGVIKIENNEVIPVLSFIYEFIGLQNKMDIDENKLSVDTFIVKKEDSWFLVNEEEEELTPKLANPILCFDEETFISKKEYYNLYNYNGTLKLTANYNYLNYISDFLEVKDVTNHYYIMDANTSNIMSNIYAEEENNKIEAVLNENNEIEILVNDEVKETIEIS